MNQNTSIEPLPVDALYTACDPGDLPFETTNELEDIGIVPGQRRATDAVEFGIQIKGSGYNIYALGPPGTGKLSAIKKIVQQIADEQTPAPDWCYVNNFDEPHKPKAIKFSPGQGVLFKQDIEQLFEELIIAIPAAFESDEYRARIHELEEELTERQSESLHELREEAKQQSIALIKTPTGFAFAPMDNNDEVLSPEQFNQLDEQERKKIHGIITRLQDKLKQVMSQYPSWRKEIKEKVKELDREIAEFAISPHLEQLKEKYKGLDEIIAYLEAVEQDVIKNIRFFLTSSDDNPLLLLGQTQSTDEVLQRYSVNLIVDNSDASGAPIVLENLPSHANLSGCCEYQSHMGTLSTNFTLIKAGALHRANGGYLILDIRKVLFQPYAWESLKRILLAGEIRIESLERAFGLISTVALEPEPIPLNVKVILVGDRFLYYTLNHYDPEFQDLFKIAADFDDALDRNSENQLLYARMIGSLAREHQLRPLEKTGVARVIEHSARIISDTEKLSTHQRSITDLLVEADYFADNAGHSTIEQADVEQAIEKQIHRSDRIRERVNEEIRRGTIFIDTTGEAVGQVNGLAVMDLGNFSFGKPSRITATVRLGEGEVIDIEREAELGGAIHSKGVMILSSFLASRYAKGNPLSITASIVFEQSYGEVEGDSASVAELCALLSVIGDLPVTQSLAVTGSINQHGRVQPIGGVNEKIEGFYDICRSAGLTGDQGVLIPQSNVKHLMLRKDIITAASEGTFHIYAVETIDQALELLLGVPAGIRDDEGLFPEGTVNACVEEKLLEYASIRRLFAQKPDQEDHDKDKE